MLMLTFGFKQYSETEALGFVCIIIYSLCYRNGYINTLKNRHSWEQKAELYLPSFHFLNCIKMKDDFHLGMLIHNSFKVNICTSAKIE